MSLRYRLSRLSRRHDCFFGRPLLLVQCLAVLLPISCGEEPGPAPHQLPLASAASELSPMGRAGSQARDAGGAGRPRVFDPLLWNEQAELKGSDAAINDTFGGAVALSGDTLVVGAPHATRNRIYQVGQVYVFVRSGATWTQQAILTAKDKAYDDRFGSAVAISGDTIVVGAPRATRGGAYGAGTAYAFVRSGTTWTQQAQLDYGDYSAQYGYAVAVAGDRAVIGASTESRGGLIAAGSATVFVRSGTTWSTEAKLYSRDAATAAHYGTSVAISESQNTVVVGCPFGGRPLDGPGAAYVYVRSGAAWSEQAVLSASDKADGDHLGSSVAISGDTLVAGAADASRGPKDSVGVTYVFVRSGTTWTEQAQLTASDMQNFDGLGSSVAISGDTVVAGADGATRGTTRPCGAAYVFGRSGTTWSELGHLTASDKASWDSYGSSVATSGGRAVVGASGHNSDRGGAYVVAP